MTTRIYLAGPIAGCTDDEAHGWRDQFMMDLREYDVEILNPMDRDFRFPPNGMTYELASTIVAGDKDDIDRADIVVANYWKTATGTAMEMLYAYDIAHTEVIVIVPGGWPAVSPWIMEHSDLIVTSAKDAVAAVAKRCQKCST